MGDSPLTEEQIANMKEIFTLFDQDNDGVVEIKHLGMMVRGLGQYPTNAEIRSMEKEVDPNEAGFFEYADFVVLMAKYWKDVNAEAELLAGFTYDIT